MAVVPQQNPTIVAIRALPLAGKLAWYLMLASGVTLFVAVRLQAEAKSQVMIPESGMTLLGISSALTDLSMLLLAVGAVLFVISIPLLSRERTAARVARHASLDPDYMLSAAALFAIMEREIREREAEFELYDEMEKLKDAGVETLIERQAAVSTKGNRLNVLLFIGGLLATFVVWWLER